MAISFGGSQITRPGSYSLVDTTNMVPKSLGSFRVLAVVGTPGTASSIATAAVVYFNSPSDAFTAVGAGVSLDLMNIAWQHGADLIAFSPVIGTGAAGALQDADWQKAVDNLENEFVDGIILATTAGAILTKLDTHVTTMSNVSNRKERRGFYGHATGLANAAAVTSLANTITGERAVLASPGVYVLDATGAKVLKDSTYLAAALAGLWASQPPQLPLTYKYVKFAGLEKIYKAAEIDSLLTGGVLPVESVRGKGFRIVKGITTSVAADLTKQEISVSTLKDTMSKDLRDFFETKYVGQAGVSGIEVSMYNDLISKLEDYKKSQWVSDYVKESARVVKNATAFSVEWEGKPTLPINNFLITSHFTL